MDAPIFFTPTESPAELGRMPATRGRAQPVYADPSMGGVWIALRHADVARAAFDAELHPAIYQNGARGFSVYGPTALPVEVTWS